LLIDAINAVILVLVGVVGLTVGDDHPLVDGARS